MCHTIAGYVILQCSHKICMLGHTHVNLRCDGSNTPEFREYGKRTPDSVKGKMRYAHLNQGHGGT